jgi:hypothetical protein
MNILVEDFTTNIIHQKAEYVLKDNEVEVWYNGVIMFIYGTLKKQLVNVYNIDAEIPDFKPKKYNYVDGEVVANPEYEG